MKNMKKKYMMFILIALIIASGFFLLTREKVPELNIVIGDKTISVDSEYIYSHSDVETFPSVVRSSGQKPVETEYTGIELSKLFQGLGVEPGEKITLNAEDGYRIMISKEEIDEPHNVYLTFARDGEYMLSRRKGGNGPYQLVIRRDPFSQRWIKHVNEIIAAPAEGADD